MVIAFLLVVGIRGTIVGVVRRAVHNSTLRRYSPRVTMGGFDVLE
jgi:hypothetical protein